MLIIGAVYCSILGIGSFLIGRLIVQSFKETWKELKWFEDEMEKMKK